MSEEKQPVRFRSRFPKAQPNIAVSSGLARIRRLSGHYSSNEQEKQPESQEPSTPALPATPRQLIESVLSPKQTQQDSDTSTKPVQLDDLTPSLFISQSVPSPLTFRQAISSVSQPSTPLIIGPPQTPGGSQYSPIFTKEHIMNIIKHKAMQKLKKIESETLKEKRKKYKRTSALFLKTNNSNLIIQSDNSNLDESGLTLHSEKTNVVDRSKLRMRDFLYFNSKIAKKPELSELIIENDTIIVNRSASSLSLVLNSENETTDTTISETLSSKSSTDLGPKLNHVGQAEPKIMAPQLRIADDGTIVINEESLVIQREYHEPVYDSTIVESEHNDNLTYNSYRKFHHTKKWTAKETAKFYKALSMVGTDFTMIQKLFSHRNRDEIKRKFKREEKINQALIDKILSKTAQIDLSIFVSSDTEEEAKDANGKKLSKKKSNSNNKKPKIDIPVDEQTTENTTKKKTKLKRVQKRAFIDSESDNESSPGKVSLTKKKTQTPVKSKQFISESESSTEDSQPVINLEPQKSPLAPFSSFLNTENRGEIQLLDVNINDETLVEEKSAEEEEEEGFELILDLDNDCYQINDHQDLNKPRDDETVILDLDSNKYIRSVNSPAQFDGHVSAPTPSSITITKLDPKGH